MENFEEIERERAVMHDVDDTIFVAVGKKVDKSKTTLFWAVRNFAGKKICLLHVHKPARLVALEKRELRVGESGDFEMQNVQEIMNQYLLILSQAGVQGDTVWIEMDSVEQGIVEVIIQHDVRWLVMGAAADKYFSKELVQLKSSKAIFVCKQAPISCHIWFACKGCLIYTRERSEDRSELETVESLQLLNWDRGKEQSEHLNLQYHTHMSSSPELCRC